MAKTGGEIGIYGANILKNRSKNKNNKKKRKQKRKKMIRN